MRKPVQERRVPAAVAAAVAAKTPGAAAPAPAPPQVSFATDIRPLFQQFQGPMAWRFDLTDYDAVVGNAERIYERISGSGGPMPPPPFPPLTQEQIATFATWMEQGCPP